MKTLYLDCNMGAAGDMLTAALLELVPDREAFVDELNNIGLSDIQFVAEPSVKCGITGTHMKVLVKGLEEEVGDVNSNDLSEHNHEHEHGNGHSHEHSHEHTHDVVTHTHSHEEGHSHSHTGLAGIRHIVNDHLKVSDKVKSDVIAIYDILAEAESKVHNQPVDQIHFHEVGNLDAIADITAVCLAFEKIGADQIIASPVHVGSGNVKCAHGILPVPAPATAEILKDVPIYGGRIKGELCTPTGAAILKHFATKFGDMPVMKPLAYGYGMGKKDFEICNAVRVVLGETGSTTDMVVELQCNVDDMTPESIAFATELLLANGAVEVYTINVGMKKNRPGILLCVMCKEENREKVLQLIFKHTSTIGIREHITNRYILNRRMESVSTPYGDVRKKVTEGFGVRKAKLEYDDLSKIAREQNMSLEDVRAYVRSCEK